MRAATLRWKLVLALVLTSAATLVAATAALLPPLEHRIAAERLDDLSHIAGTAALDLRRLPARDLRPRSPRLARIVNGLQARTGARIALYGASGGRLGGTDPVPGTPPTEASPDRLAARGAAGPAGGARRHRPRPGPAPDRGEPRPPCRRRCCRRRG